MPDRAGGLRGAGPLAALAAALLLSACAPASRGSDSTKQLEAEIAVALDLLRDLRASQNRLKPNAADPAELATVDRQMREFVAKEIAPKAGVEDHPSRLERIRNMLLRVINDSAVEGARTLGLPEPTPTTVETLRSAIKARP